MFIYYFNISLIFKSSILKLNNFKIYKFLISFNYIWFSLGYIWFPKSNSKRKKY